MKTAADYLRAMFSLNVTIESKRQRIGELQLLAESNGGIRYDKPRVISSLPHEAGFENRAIDVTLLQKELQRDIDQLTSMYDQGRRIIDSVKDPIDRAILNMLYVDGKKIKDVAVSLHYSESNIYYRKKNAMDSLEKKLCSLFE